jgi:uncharacterized membrane protein
MAKVVFSLMGCITFCYAAVALLVLVLSTGHSSDHFPPLPVASLAMLLFLAVALTIVGLGLIGLRRWAALAFSLLALYLSFWAFADAFHAVPGSSNGIRYGYGLLLICPSVFTVRYWHTLVWRKKKSEKAGNPSPA